MHSNRTGTAAVQPCQRYAWCGPSLLVTDERGACDEHDPLTGLYFREARHLRTLRLEVNGVTPWLCSSGSAARDELTFVYVHPELTRFGGGGSDVSEDEIFTDDHGIAQRSIDIRLRYHVGLDGLLAELTVGNRSRARVTIELAWRLEADFADIQEAQAGTREQCADVRVEAEASAIRLRYLHPDLPLETLATGSGAGWTAKDDGSLVALVSLEPQQVGRFELQVAAIDPAMLITSGEADRRRTHMARHRELRTSVELPMARDVEHLIRQAADDLDALALLDGAEDEWLAVQAGIPLYPALFGRDTLTVGWQAAMLDRGAILEASLARLGRMQSDRVDDWRDEEPGRLPFQVRHGPLGRLNINPYSAYYADFASPLMFVIALAHLFSWTGDKTCLARHWDTARRILDWAREYGDRDGDGYLEYATRSARGTKNQGWKDSGNAILYDDGRPVPAPLATCELQGYWFAAQQLMAVMSWVMDERESAKALWRDAMDLKERFNHDWWLEDERFIALALDADRRPARSTASNAGHCLAAGIIDDDHIPAVVERLFGPDMFSGWGIRTLSTTHPSYNPLSYHLGSVWPVENATIAFGLRRFGFDERALGIASAMIDLASLFESGRVPECVGGYARADFSHPGAYPRANPIQAWNQSALALILHTVLGLQPVATLDLLVVDPVLPPWLPEVILRGIRLGEANATIRFWRDDEGRSHAEVLRKHGTLHLLRQPPLESLRHGVRDRFSALVESIWHH